MGITVVSAISSSPLPALDSATVEANAAADFATLLADILPGLPSTTGLAPTEESPLNSALKQLFSPRSDTPGDTRPPREEAAETLGRDEELVALSSENPALATQLISSIQTAQQIPAVAPVDRESSQNASLQALNTEIGMDDKSSGKTLASEVSVADRLLAATNEPQEKNTPGDTPGRFAATLAQATSSNSPSLSLQSPASTLNSPHATQTENATAFSTDSANIAAPELPPTSQTDFNSAVTEASAQIRHKPVAESNAITTPLHEPHWAQDFSEKIVWVAKNDQQTAQISINPPQLGPMQISINLNGDQANAVFASPHAEVRQAIEDALPRLREMLSASGITLGDANVGTQLPQQSRENAQQFTNSPPNGGRFMDENAILGGDSGVSIQTGSMPIQRGRGLVDLFA